MSLLEDIFLEDEAGEAQELERIIDGDEYEGRAQSPQADSDANSEREDEAEEDKRRVDPTKAKPQKVVKNPRFVLNPARLTGPRGIEVIPEHFKDIKLKGKGHEKEDLDLVLKKLEHWAYRLYPKFKFEDCLKKIETLGKKRPVMVQLHKIRSDQFMSEETVVQKDSSDEEELAVPLPEEDEFDRLLQQQIELARATPAPGSVKKGFTTPGSVNKGFTTPSADRFAMPKATSSPSISDEQRERMLRNRQLAEERRLAKLKKNEIQPTMTSINEVNDVVEGTVVEDENLVVRKHNKSNVIDSSDDECEVAAVNESISVDVHIDENIVRNEVMEVSENGDYEVMRHTDGSEIIHVSTNVCKDIEGATEIDSVYTEIVNKINIEETNKVDSEVADKVNSELVNKVDNNMYNLDTHVVNKVDSPVDQVVDSDKDNINLDSKEVEDVMELDFGDDF